jgi:glycosyltransferase involved in cell wall biosynthesis
VPALAAALNRILGDHRLRDRLGAAGSSYAKTNFDWRSSASRYVELAYAERANGASPE